MELNWLYVGGYVAGAMVSARLLYSAAFNIDYKDSMEKGYGPQEKVIEFARKYGLYFAWLGIVWPVAWPTLVMIWFITRPTGIEKNIEKRKAEEKAAAERSSRIVADMIRLRNHFESLNMECPDTATLNKIAEDRVDRNEDID